MFPPRGWRGIPCLAVALAACGSGAPATRPVAVEPLATVALAGAPVIVPPVTMILGEPGLPPGTLPAERAAALTWADSTIGDLLQRRAPEVRWILPPELRRIARRSPGVVHDPDQMGQAALRVPTLRTVPDPLRGHLRTLMALAGGGRHAFVPAALLVAPDSAGLRVRLVAVLTDGRTGAVVWRADSDGVGSNLAAALEAALARIFPTL